MKEFFNNYSYSAVKMFVNQFAISIFGATLSMATTSSGNDTISIVVGVLSTLFFLFLIYTLAWELGAKDRISVDIGKKKKLIHTGLFVSLIANIPNLLIAILYVISYPFSTTQQWAGAVCGIIRLITILLQGMFFGITTSIEIGGTTLNFLPITYFAIMIPSLLTSWFAYYLGFKNRKLISLFSYQAPDKTEKK